ncbi:MAG: hypothetical protein BGO62_08650 [Thiobacillus sp. 65-1402]|nr:MAG: hypothetical protein BGO62_08650 [Thiobacillus sp. 65-1402]
MYPTLMIFLIQQLFLQVCFMSHHPPTAIGKCGIQCPLIEWKPSGSQIELRSGILGLREQFNQRRCALQNFPRAGATGHRAAQFEIDFTDELRAGHGIAFP